MHKYLADGVPAVSHLNCQMSISNVHTIAVPDVATVQRIASIYIYA